MRKFTLFVLAVISSAAVFAQKPYGDIQRENDSYLQKRHVKDMGRVELLKSTDAIVSHAKLRARAEEQQAITEQPEGQLQIMRREGTDWLPVYGSPAPADYTEKGTYVVKGTDGNYYFKGFVSNMVNGATWVKGEVEGDIISIPVGQISTQLWYDNGYTNELYTYYLYGMKAVEATGYDWNGEEYTYTTYELDEDVESIQLKLEADGSITSVNPDVLVTGLELSEGFDWLGYGDVNSSFHPFDEVPQTAPDGLEFSDYVFKQKPYLSDDSYAVVSGALTADAFYVHGFSSSVRLPEGYVVKAEIDGDKAVIRSNQFLGVDNTYSTLLYVKATVPTIDDNDGWKTIYDEEAESVTLSFDAENRRLVGAETEGFLINAGKEELLAHDHFYALTFYQFDEKPAEPAPAEWTYYMPYAEFEWGAWGYAGFNIYTADVDGNYILPDKLYYQCFLDDVPLVLAAADYEDLDEDLTVIPYAYSNSDIVASDRYHYVYFYSGDFSNFGVQTIYRGGGEEKRSPIVYYSDPETVGVGTVTDAAIDHVTYTDLSGRQRQGLTKGLNIVTVTYTNGTTKTSKVMLK